MDNASIDDPRQWTQVVGGYECEFIEVIRQQYEDLTFCAGRVVGHPVDTMFVAYGRTPETYSALLLRPDEMAALAWVATGALYNVELRRLLHVEGSDE